MSCSGSGVVTCIGGDSAVMYQRVAKASRIG
jgi:hypothetical protein